MSRFIGLENLCVIEIIFFSVFPASVVLPNEIGAAIDISVHTRGVEVSTEPFERVQT